MAQILFINSKDFKRKRRKHLKPDAVERQIKKSMKPNKTYSNHLASQSDFVCESLDGQFHLYLVQFMDQYGQMSSIQIYADSIDDARRRIKSIGNGLEYVAIVESQSYFKRVS